MSAPAFNGRLGIVQRVLPRYRVPFFDALAAGCSGGLDLFAGQPRPGEAIAAADRLGIGRLTAARNRHLLGGPFYLCYQQGLLSWLEACQPDALIVEANPRYLSSPAAVAWMHRRSRRVVGWGLGAPPPAGPLSPWRRSARLRFLLRFDALIAYSARGAEQYAELGFPPGRIYVAPNAAAPRPRHPMPERPERGAGQRPVVLYVGRLQARKRVDDLLRACARLPAELRPRLLIVGEGPESAALRQLAAQVYPEAEFLGAAFGEALRPYFLQADLFVLPGTGGLAIQEAMSYGLPVLVGEGDGTQGDLVRPGNGWQIPSGDAGALAETLRSALSDLPRLRRMGAESYRIVAEEINLEQMAAVFIRAAAG